MYCGDMFNLKPADLGPFDCIWECNAIVSINGKDKICYAHLLKSFLKPEGRILMTTWNYEQKLRPDRPFNTPPELIQELFPSFTLQVLEKIDMAESDFIRRFNLPWLLRPVLFMKLKQNHS